MESFTPPTMKPVLVTKASDDIRAIRGADASTQQAVPTLRALRDVMAGDIISISSPSSFDKKYIKNTAADGEDPVYRIDLDYITDPSVRYVQADTYVNGPAYAYYLDEDSVKHVQEGILHTYAQLPNEELTWDKEYWMSPNCISEPTSPKVGSAGLRGDTVIRHPVVGATIRQLFYPKNNSVEDSNGYTRIGTYEGYDEDKGVEIYKWGSWGWISGKKMYIVVTEATADEVTKPVVNAIYSVHTSISEFVLPSAKDLAEGTTITLIQYPDPNSDDPAAWASLITYKDPDDASNVMRTLATAAPIRNTTKNRDGYLEGLAPTEYEFVVVPVIEEDSETKTRRQIGRTWELQIDADETDFTAGISDLLSSHTDPGVNDIVDYAARKYKEEDSSASQSNTDILAITRAMMTSGYVYGTVRKEADGLSNLWSLTVQKLTVSGADNPNFIEATESYPDAATLYFVRRTMSDGDKVDVTYQLALDPDYPELDPGYLHPTRPSGDAAFPKTESQYYKLVSDAKLVREDIINTAGSKLVTGKEIRFRSYFNRHDLIYVAITPSGTQNHSEARKFVNVKLGIIPDPHQGVYICNDSLNPSAYTHAKVVQAKKSGTIVMRDTDTYASMPIATAAVMDAYDDITKRAQKRGLLTGIIDTGKTTLEQLNAIKQTGFYYVTPSDVTSISLAPGSYPLGITADAPAHLVVIGGETASADMRNADDQYFETEDDVFNPDKTYYYWSIEKSEYVKSDTVSFDDERKPYYEKREIGYNEKGADVIQILAQFGATKNIWFRKLDQATDSWSIWSGLSKDPYVMRVPMGPGIMTTLESSAILTALKQGRPYITLELTRDANVDVMLPGHYPPGTSALPVGTDFMFRITGTGTVVVNFRYTDITGIKRVYTVKGIPDGSDAVVIQLINSGSHWMFGRTDISFGTAVI